MSSTIYGFIACNSGEKSYEEAVEVIANLPESGQLLVKHLFNVIPCSSGSSYYMNMITFGIDQKDDWCVGEGFISQFEKILVCIDWSHAELIHTYSGTRVAWNRTKTKEGLFCARSNFERVAYGSYHDLKEIQI